LTRVRAPTSVRESSLSEGYVVAVARKPKDAGFEGTLAQLEELVARMEAGDLPLEEALRSFERGVALTRECQAALQAAQQRVQVLTQRASGPVLEDFGAAQAEPPSPTEP
jgi:exodeoxyribonuclease VII small subunit